LLDTAQIILPPPAFKGPSKIVNKINQDWGKIVIIDNAGRSKTLYATSGDVNLDAYELPPLPPSGIFDVRYGSGRYAEDLDKNNQQIEMSGLVYPVTVRSENMGIRVKDEIGKEINKMLKSGEEVLINSSMINKLLISVEIIPEEYSLAQNYPNPFNPNTTIEFSIPENSKEVSLIIYNTLGEKVAQLVNGNLDAGYYQFQWNANNFASGLYIYELRTEKFLSTKKMILLK
ncbi:MAG TPA: T9SS type A sorting domain-containing protein, partial [Ignavibacteriaceae bacterium]|nr:T9SS type A sorting domain-containing protein [Ignavibacteriaceae bacterium]